MQIYKDIEGLQAYLAGCREAGKRIGFVPTMGALHAGHLSLVAEALRQCDVCVVSVFVNPTQFNDPKDLETYPRDFESDARLLASAGASAVFHPSVEVVYPQEDTRTFDVGAVAEVMEGAHRPGHFRGVMQVVSRLFDIVQPHSAFFGEKDFQQIAVIRAMCDLLQLQVQIVPCPIVRESDGLAMSSRNQRLSPELRAIAPQIYAVLQQSQELTVSLSPRAMEAWVSERINAVPNLRVEYYSIVDGRTLQPIDSWSDSAEPRGCITVFCGEVRLIDNIPYSTP